MAYVITARTSDYGDAIDELGPDGDATFRNFRHVERDLVSYNNWRHLKEPFDVPTYQTVRNQWSFVIILYVISQNNFFGPIILRIEQG